MKNSQDCNRVEHPLYEKFINGVADRLVMQPTQDSYKIIIF